jgi:hypothetical protein
MRPAPTSTHKRTGAGRFGDFLLDRRTLAGGTRKPASLPQSIALPSTPESRHALGKARAEYLEQRSAMKSRAEPLLLDSESFGRRTTGTNIWKLGDREPPGGYRVGPPRRLPTS